MACVDVDPMRLIECSQKGNCCLGYGIQGWHHGTLALKDSMPDPKANSHGMSCFQATFVDFLSPNRRIAISKSRCLMAGGLRRRKQSGVMH